MDEKAEEMLERFQKEEIIEAGIQCQKEGKLETRKSNRENQIVEVTTANRCPEQLILMTPGVKVPCALISRNHGGFKIIDLHNAARKLDCEKIGKLLKEKKSNAKIATTYFMKTVVDKDWDMDTFNTFANKLANYSVKIKEYMDAYKQPDLQEYIDENEDKMDTISSFDDAPLVQNKTLSNSTSNETAAAAEISFSLNDVDFDMNGGTIIPQPPNRNSTTRQPLISVDVQKMQSTRILPMSPQQCQQPRQEHHSYSLPSPLSPPSLLATFMEEKTPITSAHKKLRFELNTND